MSIANTIPCVSSDQQRTRSLRLSQIALSLASFCGVAPVATLMAADSQTQLVSINLAGRTAVAD